ncbi:MAG: hypothetical protein AB7S26_35715 [Sandaracinaceae bacterium]
MRTATGEVRTLAPEEVGSVDVAGAAVADPVASPPLENDVSSDVPQVPTDGGQDMPTETTRSTVAVETWDSPRAIGDRGTTTLTWDNPASATPWMPRGDVHFGAQLSVGPTIVLLESSMNDTGGFAGTSEVLLTLDLAPATWLVQLRIQVGVRLVLYNQASAFFSRNDDYQFAPGPKLRLGIGVGLAPDWVLRFGPAASMLFLRSGAVIPFGAFGELAFRPTADRQLEILFGLDFVVDGDLGNVYRDFGLELSLSAGVGYLF